MKRNSWDHQAIWIGILAVAGFLFPVITRAPYLLHIGINIFLWSMLALGIRLVLITGHLNAAQATFMGMGAYTSALLAMKLNWSFWLCLPVSGLSTALLALIIGFPTLRLKGAYFVMVTFGITEVFRHIWMMWKSLFGGPQGLLNIPKPDVINITTLTIAFTSKVPFYYLALGLLLVTLVVMRRIDLSQMGKTLRAIPQAETLAESVGINVMKYKILAFVIGSFFAGLAGSFYAHYLTYASPWDFTWMNSQYMLLYTVIGGAGSIVGPVLGCIVMLGLDEILRPLKQYMPIILGSVLVIVLIYLPGGLITIPERLRSVLKRRQT